MKYVFNISLMLVLIAGSLSLLNVQDASLTIGDPAPEIGYSKWIKGMPVKNLKSDQVYVLEFWATWCGPCKAQMPHLTKLQQEYKDKAVFIGVNVFETRDEKPYDLNITKVTDFVNSNSIHMNYSVFMDDNKLTMADKWMKASRQNGIPATFIIKNDRVIWIGHPMNLDSTLMQIFAGTYDMEHYKTVYLKKEEESYRRMEARRNALDPIDAAMKARDYKKALEMAKIAKQEPLVKDMMDGRIFSILLDHFSEAEAITFAGKWMSENERANTQTLNIVAGKEALSKKMYLWAANLYGETNTPTNFRMLHALAQCYSKAGDQYKAVLMGQQALVNARAAASAAMDKGQVIDIPVKEYENALDYYQEKIRKKRA